MIKKLSNFLTYWLMLFVVGAIIIFYTNYKISKGSDASPPKPFYTTHYDYYDMGFSDDTECFQAVIYNERVTKLTTESRETLKLLVYALGHLGSTEDLYVIGHASKYTEETPDSEVTKTISILNMEYSQNRAKEVAEFIRTVFKNKSVKWVGCGDTADRQAVDICIGSYRDKFYDRYKNECTDEPPAKPKS